MFANQLTATVLSVLLVVSTLGAGATAAATSDQHAYAGTYVSFDATSDAMVEYAVNDEIVLESVRVQSKRAAENQGSIGIGTDLSAVTTLDGAGLAVDADSETHATLTAESGARMHAHDNPRGILVVEAGDEAQYLSVNVSAATDAETAGDRVVVTTQEGTEGTFLVVGDGDVAVNDDGNVTADLGADSQLIFRSYPDGRDGDDERDEQLIADGVAAAEVYVSQRADHGGEVVADVVQYSGDTRVNLTQSGENTVRMTAERSSHDGRIVIASVAESVVGPSDDLEVAVDGHAAARAETYGELRNAIDGGEQSRYLVRHGSKAGADATVLVAVNHFSERDITIRSADGADSDPTQTATGDGSAAGDGAGSTTSTLPGFGFGVGLLALLALALIGRRRS